MFGRICNPGRKLAIRGQDCKSAPTEVSDHYNEARANFAERLERLKRTCLWIAAAVLASAAAPCASGVLRFDSFKRGDREISILLGGGANHRIPEAAKDRFQYSVAKIRWAVFTSPRTQLALDAATGINNGGANNCAFWATGGYRRYFLMRGATAVGWEFNFGAMRLSHKVSELGTRTNFTEQLGVVFERGVSENSALTLEYRFSHISNAGIKLPNVGINTSAVSLGYSWYR